MRRSPVATAISSILALGALPGSQLAMAQDVTEDVTDREFEAEMNDGEFEEVIVTGSRIRKDIFTSSAPMDVIGVDAASVQGIANIGQLLQQNTLSAGSSQVTGAISTENVVDGGLGITTVSLRGLGANRTLTLINGRRSGPSGVQGAVSAFDLNVLPLAAIERVEILKDGASSIYGSDAIAGVVNLITKKDDGGTIDAFISQPTQSGGEESRLSVSWGRTYDRGYFRVTADYNKREELKRGERDYFDCGNEYVFDPDTNQRADLVDPRTGKYQCSDSTWGHIWLYEYGDDSQVPGTAFLLAQPDFGDNLANFIPGYAPPTSVSQLTAPSNWFPVGYDRFTDGIVNEDHPYQDKQSLQPEVELTTFYGEGELNISDSMSAYTELLFNRRETYADSYRQYWGYVYTGNFDYSSYGTGVPGGGNSLAAAAGWFGEYLLSPLAMTDFDDDWNTVDYTRAVVGIRGIIQDRWDWDLSYMYSESDASYTQSFVYADSLSVQNYLPGSCVGLTTSVRGASCIDVPWFNPLLLRGDALTPELKEYLFGEETGTTKYTQWSVDGFMSGDIMKLPAGPLGAAIGFQYREDELNDTPGESTLAGNVFFGDEAGITKGSDKTTAVFAELNIPVLADMTGVRDLSVNASARYTDVESYGSDTTWKAGINWSITDSFRIRGNKATSFRSPALYELYLTDRTSSIAQNADPCIQYEQAFAGADISENVYLNCRADPRNLPPDYTGGTITPTVFTGGGAGVLEAETASSLTVGFVWQPEFANISFSVDYFEFDIRNQVDQLGGRRIIQQCYESDFGFAFGNTEPLCQLFDRSAINSGLDNIRDSFINIAEQDNRGWDFATRYGTDLSRGDLLVDLRATLQTEDTKALFADTREDFNGRVGEPEWVGNLNVNYVLDNWSFDYGLNWIGPSDSTEELGGNTVSIRGVTYRTVYSTDSIFYSSLSASYGFENGVKVIVGGANIFDQEPPQLSRVGQGNEYSMVGNGLLASNYDMLGSRWFVNVSWDFE